MIEAGRLVGLVHEVAFHNPPLKWIEDELMYFTSARSESSQTIGGLLAVSAGALTDMGVTSGIGEFWALTLGEGKEGTPQAVIAQALTAYLNNDRGIGCDLITAACFSETSNTEFVVDMVVDALGTAVAITQTAKGGCPRATGA